MSNCLNCKKLITAKRFPNPCEEHATLFYPEYCQLYANWMDKKNCKDYEPKEN